MKKRLMKEGKLFLCLIYSIIVIFASCSNPVGVVAPDYMENIIVETTGPPEYIVIWD